MSFLDKIISPAPSAEELAKLNEGNSPENNLPNVAGSNPVLPKAEDNAISESLPAAPISEKPPFIFKPLDEASIPPLENINPTVTSSPPISEGDGVTAGEAVHSPSGTPGNPELQPVGDEPGNPDPSAKRGRGRPAGSKTVRPPEILTAGADPEKQLMAVAGMTFDMSTGTLAMILGEEWKAKSKDEREFVVQAIANYYRATGTIDLPPGWTLAFVVGAYSLPRLTEPKTKEKLAATWYWCKTKLAGIFKKKGK